MVWPGRMGNKMRKVAYLSILLLLLTMNGHVPFTKNTRFLSLDNLKRNTLGLEEVSGNFPAQKSRCQDSVT